MNTPFKRILSLIIIYSRCKNAVEIKRKVFKNTEYNEETIENNIKKNISFQGFIVRKSVLDSSISDEETTIVLKGDI